MPAATIDANRLPRIPFTNAAHVVQRGDRAADVQGDLARRRLPHSRLRRRQRTRGRLRSRYSSPWNSRVSSAADLNGAVALRTLRLRSSARYPMRRLCPPLTVDRAVLNSQRFDMLYNALSFFANRPLTPSGDSASLTVHALANPLKSASRAVAWPAPGILSFLSWVGESQDLPRLHSAHTPPGLCPAECPREPVGSGSSKTPSELTSWRTSRLIHPPQRAAQEVTTYPRLRLATLRYAWL